MPAPRLATWRPAAVLPAVLLPAVLLPTVLLPTVLLLGALGCNGFSKLDWSTLSRATWQRPDDVVAALDLAPDARVADLGAGEGYFVPYLLAAVPEGRVFAVDVDDEALARLEERFGDEPRVEVVSAEPDDPGLPDGAIDLVLLVNTYHHIDDRPAYFRRLRRDLAPDGRVALLEPDPDQGGLLGGFTPRGHGTPLAVLEEEMGAAGYRRAGSHDFLPLQQFELFAPDD